MSILKLAMIGDPHLAINVSVPAGRHPETFYQEQRDKLAFIKQFCKDNNIQGLVLPGDIFNYKTPTLYTAVAINSLMKELADLRSVVPLYSISGNHDIKFSSRDLKDESVYNIFVRGSVLEDIHNKTIFLADNVTISGLDYTPNKEQLMQEIADLNNRLIPENINILVVHEHLLPDGESIPFGSYFNYKEFLKFTNIQVIMAGHLHKGFPTMTILRQEQEARPMVFVNPWSLTRLSRDNYALDASHKPEIVTLTINTETGFIEYQHTIIPHKSPDEAFITDSLVDESEQNLDISEFVSQLTTMDTSAEADFDLSEKSEKVKEKIQYYIELSEK